MIRSQSTAAAALNTRLEEDMEAIRQVIKAMILLMVMMMIMMVMTMTTMMIISPDSYFLGWHLED